ncbi:MAG: methylmalonyl-CoA mutase family protein [Desulfobacterales bacterium]
MGGTQSLHTNSFDEAVSLPTDLGPGSQKYPDHCSRKNLR